MLFLQQAIEVTFTQKFVMYSFFIFTPIILIAFSIFIGMKAFKKQYELNECSKCGELVQNNKTACEICDEYLI